MSAPLKPNPACRLANAMAAAPSRQRGVVMAIALIMLLMLTIIGVTSMSTGSLQEIMARNMLDRNYAFQAGESALRDAELDIESNVAADTGFTAACTDGLCLPPTSTTATPVWESVDWTNDGLTRDFGEYTGGTDYTAALAGRLNRAPKYVIEYLRPPPCDPSVPGEEIGAVVKFDKYRVTADARGRSDQARIRLQSTFRKRNGHC